MTCHPGENVRATGEFVVNLPSFEREILEMVRIVDMFAASQETMRVGMPYEGPEVAAADRSVRSYLEDM